MAVRSIGKGGMWLAVILAVGMSLAAYFLAPVEPATVNYGICLPSPGLWNLPPFLSWLLNLTVIGVITAILFLTNKTYNFIRTTEPALSAIFLIAATSLPWFTEYLNTSSLLCLVNVVSLGIIFGAYDRKNATQQIFVMGAMLGAGSMFQYAFLPMIPLYFLWALFLKVLRVKESLAFLLGIVSPYWITLGLGLVSFHDFHLPSLSPFFGSTADKTELLYLLIAAGFAAISGFLLSLTNGMKLYAGNSRVYVMNLCVMAMGLAAIICIFTDYENLTAYVMTLVVAMAVQFANICALWPVRLLWVVTAVPASVFLTLFVLSII